MTRLQTSLSFYRGKVKVFDTPVVERNHLDAADRRAAIFRFEIPASSVKPGLYTCQVNIIDDSGGRFAFPRLQICDPLNTSSAHCTDARNSAAPEDPAACDS